MSETTTAPDQECLFREDLRRQPLVPLFNSWSGVVVSGGVSMTPAEIGREFAQHLKRGINLELPPDRQPTYLKAFSSWMADLSNLCSFARAEEPDDEEVDRLIAASECLDAFAEEVVA